MRSLATDSSSGTGKMGASSNPAIGIVGGRGRMGQWFQRFLEKAGFPVFISDIGTELSSSDLVAKCQVVILAVPMDVFPEVVKQVAPLIPEENFLTDLCSLKKRQVEVMLENSRCQVCGTHPLFGPGEDGIEGRRVALCPARGTEWFSWWQGFLNRSGALTAVFTPEEHDRTMAWVQALNHFILLCLGKSLEEDGIDFRHVLELATPSFERQLNIVARLCLQDPELYATIQLGNPYTNIAIDTFTRYSDSLRNIIKHGDRDGFIKMFKEVQELGPSLLKQCRKPPS